MATPVGGVIVDARTNREWMILRYTPIRSPARIKIEHHTMTPSARAVENEPMRFILGPCDDCALPGKPSRDFVRRFDPGDNAPASLR